MTPVSKHRSAGTDTNLDDDDDAAVTTDSLPYLFFVLSRTVVYQRLGRSYDDFVNFMVKNFNVLEENTISYINKEGEEHVINSQSKFNKMLELAQIYKKEGKALSLLIDCDDLNKNVLRNSGDRIRSDQMIGDQENRNVCDDGDSSTESFYALELLSIEQDLKSKMQLSEECVDLVSETEENSVKGSQTAGFETKDQCNSDIRLDTFNGNVGSVDNDNSETNNAPQLETMSENSSFSAAELQPIWFTKYMDTMKNEIVKEVSTKVTAEIARFLMKTTLDARKIMEERKSTEIENKQYLRQVKAVEERQRKLQHKLDHTLECLKEKKLREHVVDILNDLRKVESEQQNSHSNKDELVIVSNSPRNSAKYAELEHYLCDESNISDTAKLADNELRMNCSITGHQMLSESRDKHGFYFSSQDCVSVSSDVSNLTDSQEDEENFVVIGNPSDGNTSRQDAEKFEKSVEPSVGSRSGSNDSNRDSPSFELLSQTPSSPVSICIDEDHFSTNDNSTALSSLNLSDLKLCDLYDFHTGTHYILDVHGNVHEQEQREKSQDPKEESSKPYAYVPNDFVPGNKTSRTNDNSTAPSSLKTEVNDLDNDMARVIDEDSNVYAEEYPTAENRADVRTMTGARAELDVPLAQQRNCQSQTDSGEFAQSFHSHTTSVAADNGDLAQLRCATQAAGNHEALSKCQQSHRSEKKSRIGVDVRESAEQRRGNTATTVYSFEDIFELVSCFREK